MSLLALGEKDILRNAERSITTHQTFHELFMKVISTLSSVEDNKCPEIFLSVFGCCTHLKINEELQRLSNIK